MRDEQNLVRCLIAITDKQKDSLDLLARNVCRKRVPCRTSAKISTSSIIRCLATIFMDTWDELDIKNIDTEEELLERIKTLFF